MQSARWRGTTGLRKRRAGGRSALKTCPNPPFRCHNGKCPSLPTAYVPSSVVQEFHGEKELFKSEHVDPIAASTITGKCRVLTLKQYQARLLCRYVGSTSAAHAQA